MQAIINLDEITINLLHKQTHVCLVHLAIKNSAFTVLKKELELRITGKITFAEIYDMTNYPNTINSNLLYKRVKP